MAKPEEVTGGRQDKSPTQDAVDFLNWLATNWATGPGWQDKVAKLLQAGRYDEIYAMPLYQKWSEQRKPSTGTPTMQPKEGKTQPPVEVYQDESGKWGVRPTAKPTETTQATTPTTTPVVPTDGTPPVTEDSEFTNIYATRDKWLKAGSPVYSNPQGYKMNPVFSTDGNFVEWEIIGEPDKPKDTPAPDVSNRWFSELTWQQEKAKQDAALASEELAWRKQQWEDQKALEREKLLASLSGPRDWVKYGIAQNGVPPPPPAWLASFVEGNVTEPVVTTTTGGQPPRLYPGEQGAGYVDYMGKPASEWAREVYDAWVKQGSPGPVTTRTGGGLAAANVIAPSGQWLNRAPESQKQMLAGYADWSASQYGSRTWEDVLGLTRSMLPQNQPSSRSSWRPVTSWR